MKINKWFWIGGGVLLFLAFVFSDGVRHTLSRRRAIKAAEAQLATLDKEVEETKQKINQLESNSNAYEHLVRKELGYLKPGEKEVRFLTKNK